MESEKEWFAKLSASLRCQRYLKIFLFLAVLALAFSLVYTPHIKDPFPKHIDEWHHLTEGIKMASGDYDFQTKGSARFESGFHFFLMLLYFIFGKNLILIYKFLPAIWAVFSAMALFFLVYRKTKNNFWIGILAVFFFASIKSNVNILGLWFFTPLTFALPLVFLFIHFFTEGIEKQNKKFILASLLIALVIIPVHAPSFLFAVPFLFIYSLFYIKYILKEWRFFSLFLLIPLVGLLFFNAFMRYSLAVTAAQILSALKFQKGWGVLELNNSPMEIYSLAGYIFAVLGAAALSLAPIIYRDIKLLRKNSIFILWPLSVLIFIVIYRQTGISYIVPYQRNIYYLALSLPILSAFGASYTIKLFNILISRILKNEKLKNILKIIFIIIFLGALFFFAFRDYQKVPANIQLYNVIGWNEYNALMFLKNFSEQHSEKGVVMADLMTSEAIYPVSGNTPVATIFFYGNRADAENFFNSEDCWEKNQIAGSYSVKYTLSRLPIECNWTEIYNKGNYIYKLN